MDHVSGGARGDIIYGRGLCHQPAYVSTDGWSNFRGLNIRCKSSLVLDYRSRKE